MSTSSSTVLHTLVALALALSASACTPVFPAYNPYLSKDAGEGATSADDDTGADDTHEADETGDSAADDSGAGDSEDSEDSEDSADSADETSTFYADTDGDGYGDPSSPVEAVEAPAGTTTDATDCDDEEASAHPGASEACDGIDNDCDGTVDEGCPAFCGDGVQNGDFEECDGADDTSCPGACSDLCACPSGPTGDLRIDVIDVGQGDAILVVSPDGFTMLVDAGDSGLYTESIAPFLAAAGIGGIDYTLVTHMHADHIGSMDDVLQHHPEVVASFDHGGVYDSRTYDAYVSAAGGRRTPVVAGDEIDLGPSMSAEVLHPTPSAMDDDENDRSVVVKLTYGSTTVLLGGDCESACEARIHPGLIDLYKVHHHGSSTSTTQALVDEMRPVTAMISVGADNSYGHPADTTVQRLERAGAGVYRTDEDGDVEVVSNGDAWTVNGRAPR